MKTPETETISYVSLGLICVTKQGTISLLNAAAEKITGYSTREVLNKSYADFFSDTLFGFSLKQALLKKEKKKTIFLTLKREKKEQPLEVTFSEIPENGVIIELKDASEFRKMKQTLDRNDRLKEIGEMAARLAHEIRNPLGGIEGFAELLCRDLKDDPKKGNMAQAIVEGTRLLNRVVTSVLHYARPLEVHFTEVDLIPVLQEMVALTMANEKNGKTCCLCHEKTSIFAFIDKELFQMAFLNLLRNAFEATPKQGKVEISLFEEINMICISIKDEGMGIEKENLEKIFTPFFTTKIDGSGLGLSEAHKVIEAHGGKIEVSTTSYGTIFTIKLPLKG